MLISVPNSSDYIGLNENDMLALTKNDVFIGYAQVSCITSTSIILDVGKNIGKAFNELIGECIPFTFDIEM